MYPLPGSAHVLLSTPLVFLKKGRKRLGGLLGLFASRDGGQRFARAGDALFISSARYSKGDLVPDNLPELKSYSRFALAPMFESTDGLTLLVIDGGKSIARQPRMLRFVIPRGRLGSLAAESSSVAFARLIPRLACGDALRVAWAPTSKTAAHLEVRVVGVDGFDFADSRASYSNGSLPTAEVSWPGSPSERIFGRVVTLEMRFSHMRVFGFEWIDEASFARERTSWTVSPAAGTIALAKRFAQHESAISLTSKEV